MPGQHSFCMQADLDPMVSPVPQSRPRRQGGRQDASIDARRASLAIAKNFDLAVAGACKHLRMLHALHTVAGLHVCWEGYLCHIFGHGIDDHTKSVAGAMLDTTPRNSTHRGTDRLLRTQMQRMGCWGRMR